MKRKLDLPAYLLPGLPDILWLGAFFGALGLGPRMMNMDGDLGRHLTVGRWILENRSVPLFDLFSHSMAGEPVTPHEWLAQVLFALAERWLGLDGVVLFSALVIATAFWLVYRQSRKRSASVLAAVTLTVLAMAAASLHWLTRPHIFTFLMLALWWGLLASLRHGQVSRWWLLPLVMLAWANLHGAFVAGFVTWALFGLGAILDAALRRGVEPLPAGFWRAFWLGGLSSLAATLLNPSGLGLWGTSIGYVGNRYLVGHTAEYLPPDFHDPSAWPFLLLIGLLALTFGLQARPLEGWRVLPAAAWLVMALYSARNVPLFAIVAAPLLAGALSDALTEHRHRWRALAALAGLDLRLLAVDLRLRGFLWPLLALAFAWAAFRSGSALDFAGQGNGFDPGVFPSAAVDWLAENPQPGEMFNYFPWGGYLLYRLWPEERVFIDGQTDFYGEALTRRYERAITVEPGWMEVFEQYNVGWALLPPDEPLAGALREQAGWREVYSDRTAVVLARPGK